jgi:hypothetical protein
LESARRMPVALQTNQTLKSLSPTIIGLLAVGAHVPPDASQQPLSGGPLGSRSGSALEGHEAAHRMAARARQERLPGHR